MRAKTAFLYGMVIVLMLANVTACAIPGVSGAATPNLAGTQWKLVSMGAPGNPQPVVSGSTVTLEFAGDEKRISGSTGCNRYTGTYTLTGDQVQFSQLAMTRMACMQPGVMEQEAKFGASMGQAKSVKLSGERLEITADNGQTVLIFAKA